MIFREIAYDAFAPFARPHGNDRSNFYFHFAIAKRFAAEISSDRWKFSRYPRNASLRRCKIPHRRDDGVRGVAFLAVILNSNEIME